MTFDANYTKQRQNPVSGESLYIHLSDTLLAFEQVVKSIEISSGSKILDYGAGTSPYKFLFNGCKYLKADITADTAPDFLIEDGGNIPENDGSFDMILSSQVIEHVYDPKSYFQEAYRLLKPEGKFLVSVPCLYEDHKSPNDYQRWMRQGLKRDLELAGFQDIKIYKITVGARALFFFWDRYIDSMHSSRKKVHGVIHFLLRNIYIYPLRKLIHFFSDKIHSDFRVVVDDEDLQNFYVNLFAIARK